MGKYKSENQRIHSTLEQITFIVLQREKKKTMNEITKDFYKEFGIQINLIPKHTDPEYQRR